MNKSTIFYCNNALNALIQVNMNMIIIEIIATKCRMFEFRTKVATLDNLHVADLSFI